MKFIKVDKNFKDLKLFEKLNNEAFPENERMSIEMLLEYIKYGLDIEAIYDNDEFIGFYVIRINNKSVYFYYLAIIDSKRDQGYGSKVIKLLKEKYSDYQLLVDIEKVNDKASNNHQRISRKEFYLKNGFDESGYELKYLGLDMEVLCANYEFDKEDFEMMLDKVANNNFVFNLNKMVK